eukprot:3208731-Prorocentrum_lima.AAC.1
MHVVEPLLAVVASEDQESVLVDCGHIAKASRRRVIHGLHSTPGLAPEVELIEVIEPRRPVVSAKE